MPVDVTDDIQQFQKQTEELKLAQQRKGYVRKVAEDTAAHTQALSNSLFHKLRQTS